MGNEDSSASHRTGLPRAGLKLLRNRESPKTEPALEVLGYMDCLQMCLSLHGEKLSMPEIMGLSGEAFRFLFDRNDPQRGVKVLAHNPVRATCSALGRACRITGHEKMSEARKALDRELEASGAAMLHLAQDWAVVRPDHRPAFYQVWLPSPPGQASRQTAWQAEKLCENWVGEPGFLELGLQGYYCCAVGEREFEPDRKAAALGSIRRGLRLLTRRTKLSRCSAGLAAYADLMALLARKPRADEQAALDMERYSSWISGPVRYAVSSRRAAAQFLEALESLLVEEAHEPLFKAAQHFRNASDLMEQLPAAPDTSEQGHRKALRQFARVRRRALKGLRQAWKEEGKAVDALWKVIEAEETKKQR